jgi:hypothetical protein
MRVDLPEGRVGGMAIEHFEVPEYSLENLRLGFNEGRNTRPGCYTRLVEYYEYDGLERCRLWMSDTDAEVRDYFEPAYQIAYEAPDDAQVLIGGLGLGMIVNVALSVPHVLHVDVVEINRDVIELVGPHYLAKADAADKSLVIHHVDMYDITWPRGTRWDVAWFDIWGNQSTDDLQDMARLRRSYGRRTGWNDCWGRHTLLRYRQAGW